MQDKTVLSDMIVIIPGILGSVLQKKGQDVWRCSGQTFEALIRKRGMLLNELALSGDDKEQEYLDDGVRAIELMPDIHAIPGFWKIDGYTTLINALKNNFQFIEGDIRNSDQPPANFFVFPYDWRRDNRANARTLQKHLEARLGEWRDYTGNKKAKVIILAHSMGGLISRYYLEVLGGWPDCKALFTFGTPFRGSINAINFLANGFHPKLFNLFSLDLTDFVKAFRSFTSIYQLLPIYEIVKINEGFERVAETSIALPNIDKQKARDALKFHRDIEEKVESNKKNDGYYITFPIAGIKQTTLQSVVFQDGFLSVSNEKNARIDSSIEGGDGTVPYLSAIPIELSEDYRDSYFPQKHGSLQNDERVLEYVIRRIRQMQTNLAAIRGPERSNQYEEKAAIDLLLEDVYLAEEPIEIKANVVGNTEELNQLQATIIPVSSNGNVKTLDFSRDGEGWELAIDPLPPGVYKIEVSDQFSSYPIKDVFEVIA